MPLQGIWNSKRKSEEMSKVPREAAAAKADLEALFSGEVMQDPSIVTGCEAIENSSYKRAPSDVQLKWAQKCVKPTQDSCGILEALLIDGLVKLVF